MAIITSKVLKLTFLTTGGKSFVISVPQPRENLTLSEAQTVMETVIARNILSFFYLSIICIIPVPKIALCIPKSYINPFSVGTGVSTLYKRLLAHSLEESSKANVKCTFIKIEFHTNKIEGAPFGFAFDRGCFHSLNSDEERKIFAENVAAHLEIDGLWLSIVGNADEQRDRPGPPQRTAKDIVIAVEPYFEILSLVSSHFGSNRPTPPRA